MSRPSPIDSRLAAWLEEGPSSGPDDGLSEALARVHSVRQRPAWLERIAGDTMETTWRAPMTWSSRLAFVLITISLLVALVAGAVIVGSRPTSSGPDTRALAAIPPTACPPGTPLTSGMIATIAGNGVKASTGDGGPALEAQIDPGQGIAVGPDGAIYFGDAEGAVRRIRTDGTIEVYASGIAKSAGLGFDAAGNLYVISDLARIVRIAPDGTITPVAGTGVLGSAGDEGPALDAIMGAATLAVAPDGQLYFDDDFRYRTVDGGGVIHAFAGTGKTGFSGDGGPAIEAAFGRASYGMVGVAVAPDGSVYVGDPANLRIRRVDPDGNIDTYFTSPDLRPSPYGLAVDTDGTLYIADWQASRVFRVDPDGTGTTIAGPGATIAGPDPTGAGGGCVAATRAGLNGPTAVAVRDGTVYVLEGGGMRIRVIAQ